MPQRPQMAEMRLEGIAKEDIPAGTHISGLSPSDSPEMP
jgi:hypothetical protein